VHKEVFTGLLDSLFVEPGKWVFDFLDQVEDDAERFRELCELQLVLVDSIVGWIIDMINKAVDQGLQFDEMYLYFLTF